VTGEGGEAALPQSPGSHAIYRQGFITQYLLFIIRECDPLIIFGIAHG
jgi:hypothetical protein